MPARAKTVNRRIRAKLNKEATALEDILDHAGEDKKMTAEEYVASCKDSLLDNLFLSQKTEDLGKEANENLHTFHITKELAKNITLFQVKSIIEHAVSKFTDIVTKNNLVLFT